MYTPRKGFAQATYHDQQATALAGMLANASDINLVDAAVVHEGTGFIEAGLVYGLDLDEASIREGVNTLAVCAQADGSELCIAVRNQQMDTNANGAAGWDEDRMCDVMRMSRVGGRVWVQAYASAAMEPGDLSVISALDGTETAKVKVGMITTESEITGATLAKVPQLKLIGTYAHHADGNILALVEVAPANGLDARVAALEKKG